MIDALLADIRFTSRMLRKNPAFAGVAVATLALGIGANTAIFSLVDHAILRPLAYREPSRLVALQEAMPTFSGSPPVLPVNAKHFLEWRKNVQALDSIALLGALDADLTGTGEPRRIPAARISSNLFQLLGVRPQLGRWFLPEEDQPGRDGEVIVNNEIWRRQFGSDPNVLGRKIALNGRSYQIVGVLPADFRFPKLSQLYGMTLAADRPQIWKPFALVQDELSDLGDFNYACIARLKPGVSMGRAVAEINAVEGSLSVSCPGTSSFMP